MDCLKSQAVGLKVPGIRTEQSSQMATRRLTRHKNPVCSSAIFRDVFMSPRESSCDVFNVCWMFDARRQAITCHHGPNSIAGKHLPKIAVKLAVSCRPGTSVNKEQDRKILDPFGDEQVQLVFSLISIGAVVVGNVQMTLDIVITSKLGGRNDMLTFLLAGGFTTQGRGDRKMI